jgi:hypothetical protein
MNMIKKIIISAVMLATVGGNIQAASAQKSYSRANIAFLCGLGAVGLCAIGTGLSRIHLWLSSTPYDLSCSNEPPVTCYQSHEGQRSAEKIYMKARNVWFGSVVVMGLLAALRAYYGARLQKIKN